jgi:hypothetical protein
MAPQTRKNEEMGYAAVYIEKKKVFGSYFLS